MADFVRGHNLFARGYIAPSHQTPDVEASPILSLRKLQLVSAALAAIDRRVARPDPIALGWVLSHGPDVRHFEPGRLWFVDRSAYQRLYERFSDSDIAEELLWAAASQPTYNDCESSADCRLSLTLIGLATYWTEYPEGQYVEDAITRTSGQLRSMTSCGRRSRYEPASPEVLSKFRATLRNIDEVVRRQLLQLLVDIETGCQS